MKEALLDVLADPQSGEPLVLEAPVRDGQEIVAGRLVNPRTTQVYEIRDAIPRFVPSDAYAASFGLQWQRFAQVQLDSANGAQYSRRRFDAEVGWSRTQLEQRWVLEVGCGAGRFAEIAAERAGQLVCLDYSSAVDAAAANLRRFPNVHVVQGDALHPPFKQGAFDYLYSIGVIQHTEAPLRTLQAVLPLLALGGLFAFTIYGRTLWTRLNGKYLVRRLLNTPAMPPQRLLSMVESSMATAFPVTDVLYRLPLVGRVFRFVAPVANYVDKTDFTPEQRYQEAVLDTFDMLSPTYDQPLTAEEVARALREAGAGDLRFVSRRPVVVHGRLLSRGGAESSRGAPTTAQQPRNGVERAPSTIEQAAKLEPGAEPRAVAGQVGMAERHAGPPRPGEERP